MIGNPSYQACRKLLSISNDNDAAPAHSPFQHRPQSCPKLGDFTSIQATAIDFKPSFNILNRTLSSTEDFQLGDLSKVVNQLRTSKPLPKSLSEANLDNSNTIPSLRYSRDPSRIFPVSDSEKHCFASVGKKSLCLSQASTPPTSISQRRSPSCKAAFKSSSSVTGKGNPQVTLKKKHKSPSQLACILTYEQPEKGLLIPVFDTGRTVDEAHKSLSQHLIPYSTADRHLASLFPSNAKNGIHVFLDMSNIEISFQKALRKRYGLADGARFSTLPRLRLRFLTELLVRGRFSRGLHVGCSVLPGRREPKYVADLRELGYQVDVRERKRVENGEFATPQTNPLSATQSKSVSRYVEDLVDETLQTRIAEAVMEYFQEQGTIVLATGDAKPAQYSDGFFRYVERALRMGWNVELVAWHGSLSSSWKDTKWTALWGEKFRIIELDSFIYDLLEIQSKAEDH